MNLNDLFGPNANRPDTPEFWALSQIILKLDGRMDESADKDAVFDGALAETGMEGKALAYMGMQRAFRAMGVRSHADLLKPGVVDQATKMTALYMEAFIVGANYHAERAGVGVSDKARADAYALDQIAEVAQDLGAQGGFAGSIEAILAILSRVKR